MTYAGEAQDLPGMLGSALERIRALEARFLIQGPMGPQGSAGPGSTSPLAWQRIGSVVVTLAMSPAATITFPFLSASLNHIVVFWKARTDAAVTNQGINAQFNSDSGANYYWQVTDSNNVTLSAAPGVGTTSMRVGIVPGASATAGLFGAGRMDFPNYSDAHYKFCLAHSGAPTALTAAGQVMEDSVGFWINNAPMNAIQLAPAAGGFLTDSAFWAYGIL